MIGSIPWHDWQFWLVTALALGAAFLLLRPLVPSKGRSAACPGCGPSKGADRADPATPLTVDGRRVS